MQNWQELCNTLFQNLCNTIETVSIQAPTFDVWMTIGIVVILLLCSGFVSASEIAFFSLSPSDKSIIDEAKPEGKREGQGKHRSDSKILALLNNSEQLLATILISNNLVNIAIVTLLTFCFEKIIDFGQARWLEFLVMTVLLTFLLLLFGEIVPKIYGAQHALAFSRFSAPKLQILNNIFWPLSQLLIRSKVITKHLQASDNDMLTVDDLEKAMELTDKKDIAEESNMLKGIIRFGGEMAKEIMTSRIDIVDLNIKAPFSDVLACIVDNNYSRIPVYQDTQDNIKGVLYIKDLLPHLNKPEGFRWQTLIRPAYFVPETKMIDDLLRDFQQDKVHMAIVVDEFGGTSGIVTMEDILEEIVGEINDEYDDEEKPYQRLNQNTYIFEAKTLMSDFTKILNLDDDYFEHIEGEAETLAGLLLEIKGEFPIQGERINYKNFTFDVLEVDQRRIVKVKVIAHNK
ncbi:MAG: gliding motility-associated protein GldE [Bacteroidaceae bacterium]|nr:gliding motility-associated protein GldE [Bacteroidaceae bacterium]MBQ5872126.1 gliding motility-associated protein GldE [Bacteroidaceae bacterium]